MDFRNLFEALAEAVDRPEAIEKHAQDVLLSADYETQESYQANTLTAPFLGAMCETNLPFMLLNARSAAG